MEHCEEIAVEEGVIPDEALEKRVATMEAVAAKAGRVLEEASVRAFIKRHGAVACD